MAGAVELPELLFLSKLAVRNITYVVPSDLEEY
jgi:hypothetical protein